MQPPLPPTASGAMAHTSRDARYSALIEAILPQVRKPSRYLGGETGSIHKSWDSTGAHILLAFPDIYDSGMSHVGLRILYHILNGARDTLAERVYAPWPDMGKKMRELQIPLFSLESWRPAGEFDIIGFTLQFESCYPAILEMLDLAGVPIYARDRTPGHPVILGGGPGSFNPEPIAPFFDAFLIGEAEEAILQIKDAVRAAGGRRAPRERLLDALAAVEGVYVPAHFEFAYEGPRGSISAIRALNPARQRVKKRICLDLDQMPFPDVPIVPHLQIVHDRIALEMQRGCVRGCRFCQAGMIYRPERQRSPEKLLELARESLKKSGYDDISFLSLSAGDYELLVPMMRQFHEEHGENGVAVSLPSLRTETLTAELVREVETVRQSGFTVAPEAGSQRLREVINKCNTDADLRRAVENVFQAGWQVIKLYFMIGLPTETDDDIAEIARLALDCLDIGKKFHGRKAEVNVTISPFAPKPHTPFQWVPMISREEIERRTRLLRTRLRGTKINLKAHDPAGTIIEGILSRGDRRLAKVIETAWRLGAKLDSYTEFFDARAWWTALDRLAEDGIGPAYYLGPLEREQILPWDHIDSMILKKFLWRDYQKSLRTVSIGDCSTGRCTACGVCDFDQIVNINFTRESPQASAITALGPSSRRLPTIPVQKFRIHFGRCGLGRFVSHMEMVQAIHRALRRAQIPLVFSQGFNPRPQIGFSPPCSVGTASRSEYCDVELSRPLNPQTFAARAAAQFPAWFPFFSAIEIPLGTPSITESVTGFTFRFTFPSAPLAEQARNGISAFMAGAPFAAERENKGRPRTVDLRPSIRFAAMTAPLEAEVSLQYGTTTMARVEEIVTGLCQIPSRHLPDVYVSREKALFDERNHDLVARYPTYSPPLPPGT